MGNLIFVRLMGGLGNQLFQYAAGLLQKKMTNGTLYLLKPVENKHDINDYRFELFTLGEKYDSILPHHLCLYQENGFSPWDPFDYNCPLLLLYGYFQNYKSLLPVLPEFKTHILHQMNSKKNYMKMAYKPSSKSGFIHIRRGDYLENKWTLNYNYYEKAIESFKNKDVDKWFIFSDDIKWCRTFDIFNTINKEFVNEFDPIMCLALMSEIHNCAIIANSTFSWMGAYLGCGTQNVVYPKVWIHNGTPDLFPEEWIGL